MKLWQKIFLISLAFVMLAVSVTAMVVARGSFTSGIEQTRTAAFHRHEYVSGGIVNKISFERVRSDKLVLAEEDVLAYVSEVIDSYAGSGMGLAVYNGGTRIDASQTDAPAEVPDLIEAVGGGETCSVITGDPERIIIGSPLDLEGYSFSLYTSHDISSIYSSYAQIRNFIRIMSALFGVISAALLLTAVRLLLRPLDRINASIASIADGSYDARVAPEGSAEFVTLARNVNIMAGAIEENVENLTEIADRRKTFVDNFAHEMKTPLTSIVCLADVMRIKKDLSEEERVEYSDIIAEEAKRLKNLSGKLLELTVAGHAELELRDIEAAQFLDETEAALAPVAAQRNMHLQVRVQEEVRRERLTVRADRELLSSLIFNLTDNAFKASSEGDTVEIACLRKEERLLLTVTDRGIGMEKEELRRITEPFYMVDKSRSRKAGGAGLGLALCLEIARQHGARLRIASTPGKGTRVTVNFPLSGADVNDTETGGGDEKDE
ncbi:MAG: HAMP domain-containing histidine kinase [Lachnospiraceae bacterium]|nr:HAMP domain-containing histidine kinase [Lachnospiraceae bacterium]